MDSQMTDTYFVEYTGLEVQHFRDTLLQHLGNVKKSVAERTRHQRQYERRVNKRQMQTQESKIDTGKALDVDLVDTESIRTDSTVQDDSSRSGNDIDADNAYIRPHLCLEDAIWRRNWFSPNKTTSPRSDLRWKPKGRIFKSVGLSGFVRKLFDSCTSKVDSTSINVQKEQSLDLSAGENQVVLKSSAVTTTDASNKRQQQPDSTSSTSTLATTVTANGNFDLAQVDQGSQIKMNQVKEMMQDNDLKNSKSKDKGSKSRSQSMDEQSHYKQDKTITRQSINVKRHIFNVIGGTEEFEERDLNIRGDCETPRTTRIEDAPLVRKHNGLACGANGDLRLQEGKRQPPSSKDFFEGGALLYSFARETST
ncbi:hypothetical protein Tco_1321445 [Tanacetum coccineum]